MDCDAARELLPWYLNGSLDPEEQRQVASHLAECPGCAGELADTRETFDLFGWHPPPAVLVELVAGDEPSMSRALVERHLETCPGCAAELEQVEESRDALFADAEPGRALPFAARPGAPPARAARWLAAAASLAAVATAAGWVWSWQLAGERGQLLAEAEARTVRIEERLEGDLEAARVESDELRRQQEELGREAEETRRRAATLEERVARLTAPELNVAIIDLFPAGSLVRGGPDAAPMPEIAVGTGRLVVILNSERAETVRQRVLLVDAAGTRLWVRGGLERNPTGDFTLSVPVASLARGEYAVLLENPGTDEPAERFPFRVR